MKKQSAKPAKGKRAKKEELVMRFPGGVSKCASSHPRYPFVVRYPGPNGERLAKYFPNDTEALKHAKSVSSEAGELGSAFGVLTEGERAALARYRAFEAAYQDPQPPALLDVVKEYVTRWEAARGSQTVEAIVEKYLAAKKAEGLRAISLSALATRCRRFVKDFGARPIASITSGDISDWILSLPATRQRALPGDKPGKLEKDGEPVQVGLQAKKNHRLALSGLFNFALSRGWLTESPVTNSAKPRPQKTQAGVLRPGDVARLFGAFESHAPELIPFWALRFFGGVREQEVLRMDWRMIDLPGGEIHLPDSVTKTGRSRTVKIEPALAAFLSRYKRPGGPVAPASEATRRHPLLNVLRLLQAEDEKELHAKPKSKSKGKVAGVAVFPVPMPANAARHSFATYHLLAGRHAGETALQLGHGGSPELLHRHYRGIASEAEAKAFWSIRPAKVAVNVIPFKKRARAAVKWPEPEKLKEMLVQMPATAVARQLGVSDSAVAKHARKVGITKPSRGYWAQAASSGAAAK